ncbi:MAG: dihydroorotase [Actinomycetaceae bacterium]|nr:dihydroorotase [Arcanobacterium sp.]MDD7504563.1 dihydroorotase [Actinomycetaceae bacterium]MDY6143206.1 dihydroorotase [Arcanobacterium sp.]
MTSFENCTYITPSDAEGFSEISSQASKASGIPEESHPQSIHSHRFHGLHRKTPGESAVEAFTQRCITETPNDPKMNELLHSFNSDRFVILPGLCDVHVHFREPGLSYKETIATGCAAAAHGGFTAVGAMPNLDPVPDSLEHLAVEESLIARDATIAVYPYGSITVGEKGEQLSDIAGMAPRVLAFSDDGMGVQDPAIMRDAMLLAKEHGKIIAAHCEDAALKGDGYINDGEYAHTHGHRGIPVESEWRELERDLELARDTGAAFHACHVSCVESFDLVRAAKADGVDVTCETAPHYLTLDDSMLEEAGHFKMNPPLRSPENREALLEAVADGTVDMIATDHAPHSAEEKSRGLEGSAFGIVGLETSFPVLYTQLVLSGVIDLEHLIDLMAVAPRERFSIPLGNDFTIWDLHEQYQINPRDFLSKGTATPFAGWSVYGACKLTVFGGKVVWIDAAGEDRA